MCLGNSVVDNVAKVQAKTKIWHLPSQFLCPVIGTCLTPQEVRKIVSKSADKSLENRDDYYLHTWMVSHCKSKQRVSMKVHKFLDSKYSATIRHLSTAKSSEALTLLWEQFLTRGDVAQAFWAVITHPHCTPTLQNRAYETMHMLQHKIGSEKRTDLHNLELNNRSLKHQLDALQIKQQHKQLRQQQKQQQLQLQLQCLQEENDRLTATNRNLQRQLNSTSEPLITEDSLADDEKLQQQLAKAEKTQKRLEISLQQQQQQTQSLERLLQQNLSPCNDCNSSDCKQKPDLAGQHILCVGGLHRLAGQYREIVHECNGQFSHHDGGVEDSHKRLESMLSAADGVICATDCVSHNAYYRLKKFCKTHNKKHLFLPSSGLGSFAHAITCMASAPVDKINIKMVL